MTDESFSRVELFLGESAMARVARTRIAIFGLGGVGGWCAEALARSGVGHFLLVDSDCVAKTNINRQIMADTKTIGESKVDVLAARLRAIHASVEIETRREIYSVENAMSFPLENYDYVIDAIDSLSEKAHLIRHALSVPSVTLFSSMGAALKMDLFQIRASEFRRVEGDGLARALRHKFRETGGFPARKFMCVWSPEKCENRGTPRVVSADAEDMWSARKARVNGTLAHTTATFGLALANLVLRDLADEKSSR